MIERQNAETLMFIRRNACIFLSVAFGVRDRLHLQHSEDYITEENATKMRKGTPQFRQIQEINYNRII